MVSVLAMLAGALIGGVLLRWVALAAPLWLASVFLAACAAGAATHGTAAIARTINPRRPRAPAPRLARLTNPGTSPAASLLLRSISDLQ